MTTSIHHSTSQSQLSKQSFSTHYKLVLIGQHGVGKTAILSQYINHSFIQNYIPTIGLGYHMKEIKLAQYNSHPLSFEIWDTSSFDKAEGLNSRIIEEGHIIVMVYDISRRETLEHLRKSIQGLKIVDNALLAVVCNKIDKQEEADANESQGREFAKSMNAMFHTTSAKTSAGIKNLFNSIGYKIIRGADSEDFYDENNDEVNNNDLNKENAPEIKADGVNNGKDKKCLIF